MGIDRIAMLKYGMPDLRAFFEADVRWLYALRLPAARLPDAGGGVEPMTALATPPRRSSLDRALFALVRSGWERARDRDL